MGNSFSAEKPPPSVVLVPPLYDSRERGRSRFAKSSYDRLFGQPQLRIIFEDYLAPQSRAAVRFSPQEDPRINVTAKLGVDAALGLRNGHPGIVSHSHPTASRSTPDSAGSMTLRYQPDPAVPWTFADIKTRVGTASDTVVLRACYLDSSSGTAVFSTLPLTSSYEGSGPVSAANLRLGCRYTSPGISYGLIVNPASSVLHSAWCVGRSGGLLWGVQTQPDLPVGHEFPTMDSWSDAKSWKRARDACAEASSWALAYRPEGQSAYGRGVFTAGVELRHQRHLTVSFLHHMAVQRNVRNPFENSDVVGITNYLDIALQMKTDLQPGRPSAPAPADWVSVPASAAALSESGGNTMRLGVAWQANKNVLLKGRVGLDGVAAAAVVKGWWQPSFTLGVAVSKGLDGTPARMGLTAAVETYTKLRYERSAEGDKMAGARVTQRHVASEEDVAYHEGRGLLVPLEEVDNPHVLGQMPTPGADFL